MGPKITVDSATLMNKGFEVMEAVHLFGVAPSQVQVVVHRESIIHSMVEYIDNSILAQLSVPDMRLCAQYAITYPERTPAAIKELDFYALSGLSFAKPDMETFSLLACAFDSIEKGGAVPAALNAANEVAVDAFLHDRISFVSIMDSVCRVVDDMSFVSSAHTLEQILDADREARSRTRALLKL
jgi:1-deoxy-D-xylulose-5-phosphate reductoisomerase